MIVTIKTAAPNDNRYLCSINESHGDNCTPMPSNGEVSFSVESKVAEDNYHLSLDGKCPKKQRVTFVPKQSHKSDIAKLPKELNPFPPRYAFGAPLQYFTSDLRTIVCIIPRC